ncbi:MAG: N-acetylmuramoyl-L-alanine amidase [Muribaculaceae bacterium]|nr:N-acetylmuramoyl-L-alanine amidase [Muribaculaceae bacterium]
MFQFIYRTVIIVLLSVFTFTQVEAKIDNDKKFTVVIDAGHGGKDIGATDNGVMEKNINLKVAKQLEALIKRKMKNAKTVMTRDDDTYLTLQSRADKANKAQGDLFVSIHTNSVDKKNRNRKNIAGASVYTLGLNKDENNLEVAMRENSVIELETDFEQKYSGFDPQRDESYIIFEMAQKKNLSQSIKLAEDIEKELVGAGRESRGVHQAGFWVLWATSMPAVLVELDFICNPQSAKYLSSDKGAKELAEAIYKAINRYEANWSRNQKSSSNAPLLTDTYIENENKEPEDIYISQEEINITEGAEMAVVKSRTNNLSPTKAISNKGVSNTSTAKINSGKNSQTTKSGTVGDRRKRRNSRGKELSLNNTYEKDNIIFGTTKTFSDAIRVDETAELASTETKTEVKMSAKERKAEQKRLKEEKKRLEKEAKKRSKDSHNARVNKLVTVYKIQILASNDLLNQDNSRFCGLEPVSAYKENNIYKYYYGESTDKAALEAVLADVRKKIPDAFIVSSKKSVQTKK